MPIKIRCACGNILLAPEDRIGQTGKCPNCDRSITVEMPKYTDTKKMLAQDEASVQETLKAYSKYSKKKKIFWVNRSLSLFVYLTFLLLVLLITGIHYFSEARMDEIFGKPAIVNRCWLFYKEPILMIKGSQRAFFLKMIYPLMGSRDKKPQEQPSNKTK